MFKKLLLATAVLAASSSVAFAHMNYKSDYKGEYKGVSPCPVYQYVAGPYLGLSIGPHVFYGNNFRAWKGLDGNVSLGYAGLLNPWFYLAGEVFVLGSVQLHNWSTVNGYKTNWSYGGSLIPGFMITDHVLGFLRIGVVETMFVNGSTNMFGWQFGAGGQTNIWQNWDLRGEYVYTYYNSNNRMGRPNADAFMLGLVYKFV